MCFYEDWYPAHQKVFYTFAEDYYMLGPAMTIKTEVPLQKKCSIEAFPIINVMEMAGTAL